MGTIKTELEPVARSNPFGEQQPSRAVRRLSSFSEGFLITGDMVLVSLTAIFVLRLRFPVPLHYLALNEVRAMFHLSAHFAMVVLFAVFVVMFGSARKLYRNAPTMSAVAEAVAVFESCSASAFVLAGFIYLAGATISRLALGLTLVLATLVLIAWRTARRMVIESEVSNGLRSRMVLIVGAGKLGKALESYFNLNRQLGYCVSGFVDCDKLEAQTSASANKTVLGNLEDIQKIIRRHFIDEIFITVPENRELVKWIAGEARVDGIDVRVIPDLYDGLGWGAPIEYIGMFPTMSLHQAYVPALALTVKRIVDVFGAALGLLLLSPLMLATAIVIKLESPGPVFYPSERIGRKGRRFTCYKFRTMVENAEALKESLMHLNQRTGILFKVKSDPRVTRVGTWLRRYSIDELPQLWNVVKGDMSLVGPRPPVPGEYGQYELGHLKRLQVLPGITGLWQVEARQDPSFESYISLDAEYVDHWSMWLDLKILLRTALVVLAGTGQ